MELQGLSSDELHDFLKERIRAYSTLSDADRSQVLRLSESLLKRRMPAAFVLSSARSAAHELAARAEEEAHPIDGDRQRFIETHALPPEERVPAHRQPRREAKAREREEFVANVRQLLREAGSARQPYERKKMRRLLLGIDRDHLRRALGHEGQEIADAIQTHLRRLSDLR